MTFNTYGEKGNPSLLLIPGLGVSYEIFLPLMPGNYIPTPHWLTCTAILSSSRTC